MDNKERRKALRVPVSIKIEGKEGRKTVGFGYARNLSENGMAIDAQALADGQSVPEMNSQVYLRFKLPKSDLVISVIAKVVRAEDSKDFPMIGVEFLSLSPEFQSEIVAFIERSTSL